MGWTNMCSVSCVKGKRKRGFV